LAIRAIYFSFILLLMGASCGQLAAAGPDEVSGSLLITVADYFAEHRAETKYFVRQLQTGQLYEIHPAEPMRGDLRTGMAVRANGRMNGAFLENANVSVVPSAVAAGVSLPAITPSSGDHKTLVYLLVSPTSPKSGLTISLLSSIVFEKNALSVKTLFEENSFGSVSFTGDVAGPYTITSPATCDTGNIQAQADQSAKAAGINISDYTHRIFMMPNDMTEVCSWTGYSTLGGSPTLEWINSGDFNPFTTSPIIILAHELGHGLNMLHAQAILANGSLDEYGDQSCLMGDSSYNITNFNVLHRIQEGWIPLSNIQQVTESGVYQIHFAEQQASVVQAIQISAVGIPGTLYISYRRPIGLDKRLPRVFTAGASIHYWTGGVSQTQLASAPAPWGGALSDGQTYSVPRGSVKITQISHDDVSVTVQVTLVSPAVITLTASPNPSTGTQPITLSATVTPAAATGTVTFKDGNSVVGTDTLNNGATVLVLPPLSSGSHALTAVYSGDKDYDSTTSATVNLMTVATPAMITLTASPNPSTGGQAITLSAAVTPTAATGTVTFKDGSSVVGTGTLNNGAAVLVLSAPSNGSHAFTAVYGGDKYHDSTTSATVNLTTITPPAVITLTVSPNPSTGGQAITLSATVTPAATTGTVTFKDGSSVVGTGTLNNGAAVLVLSAPSNGSHAFTAVYGGDKYHDSTISATVNLTTTQSTSSPLPGVFAFDNFQVPPYRLGGLAGQPAGGAGFKGSWVKSLSQDLTLTGAGSVGRPTATADSAGDAINFSSPIAVTAGQLFISATVTNQRTTKLSYTGIVLTNSFADISLGAIGADANFNFSVIPYSGSSTSWVAQTQTASTGSHRIVGVLDFSNRQLAIFVDPTSQSFYNTDGRNNATAMGPWSPPPNGITFTGYLLVEHLSDQATFGSIIFSTDSTPLTQNLNLTRLPTATGLTMSPGTSRGGECVSLKAGVSALTTATGSVTFRDGTATIGSTVLTNGFASLTISAGATGPHLYTAAYNGDVIYGPSTSGSVPQTVVSSSSPVITCGGVVNFAGPLGGIASGTWISIYGNNLSPTTRAWSPSDFVGNGLPTSLDDVKVMVADTPAYIYYVSPTQINALAPGDTATGTVPVRVINANGSSNAAYVVKSPLAPTLFTYSQQGGRYAISQDGLDYTLLGPAGLLGPTVATRPSTAGQVIVLYATGLGSPAGYREGQIIEKALPLAVAPQVVIGGAAAKVQYAALIGAGIYQLNVVVPQTQAGDAAIVISLNGSQSPSGVFLRIQ
jgi:uncharacterized protein (TIGR03437 family)